MTVRSDSSDAAALFAFADTRGGSDPGDRLQQVRQLAGQIVALIDSELPGREPLVRAITKRKARLQVAQHLLKRRRDRAKFFNPALFGEPVWDILLDLYVRGATNQPTSVTSACIASGVPATTALRYIRLMEREGLVLRRADTADARRNFLELSPLGRASLDNFFDAKVP